MSKYVRGMTLTAGVETPKMRSIWAFDPGYHCGWFVWRPDLGLSGVGEPILRGPTDAMAMLDEMYEMGGGWPQVIVYEDFRLRPQAANTWGSAKGLSPVYVLAWIQGICVAEGYTGGWFHQMPVQRKVITNEYLRELHWWVPGSLGHFHDAMRHLLVYLRGWNIPLLPDGSMEKARISGVDWAGRVLE